MNHWKQSLLALAAVALTGCAGQTTRSTAIEVWPDMKRQDKSKPQTESLFFADHRATRMPVPGTVARGFLKEDDAYFTGVSAGQYVARNPEALNADLIKLGQTKFNTYCSPCHSRIGNGKGIVPMKEPTWQPTNLHEDRVKAMVDGEIFTIITQGRRSMPSYRFQIVEKDRWAIISYVRALQRTSSGTLADVPQELRADLR
ncbi:MAG: cytochrome c [Bryobacteraceae bacterium]